MRFTLRDLFSGIALIAAGVGGFTALYAERPMSHPLACLLWFGSSAAIGAGLAMPLKRKVLGAVIGMIATLLPWLMLLRGVPRE